MLNRENVQDIFQEIFDDFSILEFEFRIMSPGHFQMVSRLIDSRLVEVTPKRPPYTTIRKTAFDYGKKLEPYLEEASDRLGDFEWYCVSNPNGIVQLVDKMNSPSFKIVINCYNLKRYALNRNVKKFNEMYQLYESITKEELSEIEVIMIDIVDKFDYLEFKIKIHENSTIPGLISLQSKLMDLEEDFLAPIQMVNQIYDIEDYLKEDGEIVDRMEEIGFRYSFTKYTHSRIHVYFHQLHL